MSHAQAQQVTAQGGPPSSDESDAGGRGGGLVRVTVNLTPRAYGALQRSCEKTGDSKTDTINRALVTYALIQDLSTEGGGSITLLNSKGERERLHVI